jgi:hypothetical protein
VSILGHEPEVRDTATEQRGGKQRLSVRALLRADRHDEPQQDESAGDEQPSINQMLFWAARMPMTTRTRPTANRIAPRRSKGRLGSAASGSFTFRLNRRSVAMISAWKRADAQVTSRFQVNVACPPTR